MLEGVLKAERPRTSSTWGMCFNPWYVGGGVKSKLDKYITSVEVGFNPWYVGGGVKRDEQEVIASRYKGFQSLVCWRGC